MGKFIKTLVLAVFLTSVSFAYVSAAPQGTTKTTDKKEKKGKKSKKDKKNKKDKKGKM